MFGRDSFLINPVAWFLLELWAFSVKEGYCGNTEPTLCWGGSERGGCEVGKSCEDTKDDIS